MSSENAASYGYNQSDWAHNRPVTGSRLTP